MRSHLVEERANEAQDTFLSAMKLYERILNEHADSELLPDVFSRGYALQLQKDQRASDDYARMVADYPNISGSECTSSTGAH